MTQRATRDGLRLPSTSRGVTKMAAVLAAIALLGVAACDTVAQIPFSDRNFHEIYPVAVDPGDPGQCGGLEDRATMSMVFMDNDGEPVKEGEEVALDFVEPDQDDVSFDDSAVYTLPDVECDGDDDCPSGFRCADIESQDNPGDRCQTATSVSESDHPRFLHDQNAPDGQALVVAVSEAGAWRGFQNSELTGAYPYDRDSGEFGESIPTFPQETDLGVDPNRIRNQALDGMASQWAGLNDYVEDEGRDAYFGFWTFAQNPGEVQPEIDDGDIPWTNSSTEALDALDRYTGGGVDQQRSDVYRSMAHLIDRAFDQEIADGVDTASVVFVVPGHDEVREFDADDVLDEVDQTENSYGIELDVTIIQIDTNRDTQNLVDDWTYYDGSPSCDDDSDCKNFESCREPTWYAEDQPSPPDGEDDVDWPLEDDRGDEFCLPDYDDQGRLGPIADYDRIACETGGSYHYVPQVSRPVVEEPLTGRVWASEALWEQDVFLDDNGEEGQPNLLQTRIEVDIGGTESFSFDRQNDDLDRRRVMFAPGGE